ncbi:MAG: Asp-tRNA(Asn)/Glu-tRNA(Gln) amidotransferase subunit GatA [Desulfohalobiaceae bacterium]
MQELYQLGAGELRQRLAHAEVSPEQAVQACLDRILATEPTLGALLHVDQEGALARARQLQEQGWKQEQPLWGLPVVVKDVLACKGLPATCGSRMLENFVPFYHSTVVEKLLQAGGIVLAKSNMDEFAMGSSTENSAFWATKNPWNPEHVPGGSSGGSAASVAALQAPLALGTDTGGSIRQPAGFCGLVGLKPTYGLVSRFGLIAYGSSLDQAGPLTRDVQDAALLLQVIAGHDPRDSTSARRQPEDYLSQLEERQDLQGIKIGLPREYWEQGLDPEVLEKGQDFQHLARELGAELVPISLPSSPYAIVAYYILVMAEASSNLARYDGVRYGYRASQGGDLKQMYTQSRSQALGNEVQRRIILGTYVLSAGYYEAYYRKAAQVRRLIQEEYQNALQEVDLILAPTAPGTAFRLGEKLEDPLQMYLTDVFTNPLNLTGLPGLCMPAGLGRESGLPVGMQLFAPAFAEKSLLQAARVLERNQEPLPRQGRLLS